MSAERGAPGDTTDGGLDWEWHRTEFRKALIACANAADDVGTSEWENLFHELRAYSLLVLNFRDRLSSKQQTDLSCLAGECNLYIEVHRYAEWNDPVTRRRLETAISYVRESAPLFEGI